MFGCHHSFLLEKFVSHPESCRFSLLCTHPGCWTGTERALLTSAQIFFLKDLDMNSVQQGRQLSWQPWDIKVERLMLCCHLSKMCLYCWSSFRIHQINCALAVNEQWWWSALWIGEARFGDTLPVIEGEYWCSWCWCCSLVELSLLPSLHYSVPYSTLQALLDSVDLSSAQPAAESLLSGESSLTSHILLLAAEQELPQSSLCYPSLQCLSHIFH